MLFSEELSVYIKDVVSKLVLWESNDPQIRHRAQRYVEAFVQEAVENNKIDRFMVVCDHTNNPPQVIVDGAMILDVYYQINGSDFIQASYRFSKESVSFEGVAGSLK